MVTGRGVLANCTGSKTGNFVDRVAARTFRVSRHGEITALETRPRGFDGGQASGSEGVETEPTMIEDGCRQGPADRCRTTQQARHNPRPQARSFTVFPLTLTLTSASTSGNSIVATPPPQHTASLLVPGRLLAGSARSEHIQSSGGDPSPSFKTARPSERDASASAATPGAPESPGGGRTRDEQSTITILGL